jgi:hypothetical protein
MTKNEIVARWMGWPKCGCGSEPVHYVQGPLNYQVVNADDMKFDSDRNWLHEAWVKFRDLKFDDKKAKRDHESYIRNLETTILYQSITEAFDELVKGIEWYNSLNLKS